VLSTASCDSVVWSSAASADTQSSDSATPGGFIRSFWRRRCTKATTSAESVGLADGRRAAMIARSSSAVG